VVVGDIDAVRRQTAANSISHVFFVEGDGEHFRGGTMLEDRRVGLPNIG